MSNETVVIEQDSKVFADELLLLTSGEYSEYQVRVLVRARVSFDAKHAILRYLDLFPEQRKRAEFEMDQYIAWLEQCGLIEYENYREYFLGCYQNVEEMKLDDFEFNIRNTDD